MALHRTLDRFVADDEGVTAIEYALVGALLGLAVAAGATTLGSAVGDLYDFVVRSLLAAL